MKRIIWSLAGLLFFTINLQAQTWAPDTCDCLIEMDKNANFVRFLKPCDAYSMLPDQDAYQAILEENQFKNQTYDYILQNYPDSVETINDPFTGKTSTVVKDFNFTYDDNRNLLIDVPTLTATDLSTVQKDTGVQAINLDPDTFKSTPVSSLQKIQVAP